MKYTENAINILTTKTYKGIGRAWIVKNLKGNESVESIVSLLNNNSKQDRTVTVGDFEDNKEQLRYKISRFEDCCDGLLAIGDKDFPKHRGNVKDGDRPMCLFYKGNINLLGVDNKNITVIGLLNPDNLIEAREQKIVAEIVKRGITIVSGLALGCDSISHRQAIEEGGKTIAILPSPLHNILPKSNKNLAHEIVEGGGLLVTEYFDDFESGMELSSRYKDRDRLQALFCDAIVLAASYAQDSNKRWKHLSGQKLDSGARLAMEYAKEYNIPRAVMYDQRIDYNNPMFDLNRQLINDKEKGVIIILTPSTLNDLINKILLDSSNDIQAELFS